MSSTLIIRPIEASDREDYYAIFSHPAVTEFDDFDPVTYEELDRVLWEAILSLGTREIQYGVVLQAEDRLVGVITVLRKRKYYYLGYHFNPLFHGRGYATQSVKMMLESFSPEQRQLSRLAVHPQNIASIKVALKTGFAEFKRQGPAENPEIIFTYSQPEKVFDTAENLDTAKVSL